MVFTNVVNPGPRIAEEGYKRTVVRAERTIGANATVLCRLTLDE